MAPAPAAAPVLAPEPTPDPVRETTIAPPQNMTERHTEPAPTTTRRGRKPKAENAAPQSTDVRMIAATLAARAVPGPTDAAAVVDMYFDVLELLSEGGA